MTKFVKSQPNTPFGEITWFSIYNANSKILDSLPGIRLTDEPTQYVVQIQPFSNRFCFKIMKLSELIHEQAVSLNRSTELRSALLAMLISLQHIPTGEPVLFRFQSAKVEYQITNNIDLAVKSKKLSPDDKRNKKNPPANMELICELVLMNQQNQFQFAVEPAVRHLEKQFEWANLELCYDVIYEQHNKLTPSLPATSLESKAQIEPKKEPEIAQPDSEPVQTKIEAVQENNESENQENREDTKTYRFILTGIPDVETRQMLKKYLIDYDIQEYKDYC
ncbi:Conserved_hypothetical protein [Hexamita inflata]|uniref:Uncharacterized protein n=1 Tax=Hexamita inflata TaxID=28002 RepID=A0AA86PXY8_9EUKA|nr:Conserved hypothetical protein [Hexamita inflata]